MIRFAICDDHKLLREGIKSILFPNKEIEFVGEFDCGKTLLENITKVEPEVLFIGHKPADSRPNDLIKKIIKVLPKTKILLLVNTIDADCICESVNEGASGFLHNDISSEELILAIKTVAQGEPYYGNGISKVLLRFYNHHQNEKKDSSKSDLSEREIEIIKLISTGQSSKEIASNLFISHRTVENHKNNILHKLCLKNSVELVRYAIRNKIVNID